MPFSTSAPSIQSPISTVPYGILVEILLHCLPQDRFEIRQPNTTIAPLLLCHICSSWRTIALTTPALWSHLSFSFIRPTGIFAGGWGFLQDDIDFIWWWKMHQGSNAPFLRLAIESHDNKAGFLAADATTFAFILDYMRTAQYLEIDPLIWDSVPRLCDKIAGRIAFPNLHTLVAYEYLPRSDPGHCFHHNFSALRRLALVDNKTYLKHPAIPPQWAKLTHLSITTVMLSLDFWLPLTSTMSHLQWAYIYFNHHWQSPLDAAKYKNSITRTLPHLATLIFRSGDDNVSNSLLSPFFVGLHLPALTTLFLSSAIRDWWDHTGITDIHTILSSAAALRNLTLHKYNYLSPAEIRYAKGASGDVQQIWRSAPNLVNLQLDLHVARQPGESEAADELDRFARSFFLFENRWLALDDSACPIKSITVVDPGLIPPKDQFATDAQRKPPVTVPF